jgi:hypothetical protein
MKFFLLILLHAFAITTYSQRPGPDPSSGGASPLSFINTIDGRPLLSNKYAQVVSGSPYLFDSIRPASLLLNQGYRYDSVPIKLNLLEDQVVFYKNGAEMTAQTPIATITIKDASSGENQTLLHYTHFENIYAPVDKGWYQQLYNGKALLLKRIYKKINEIKTYNSPNTEQHIQTLTGYYIFFNKKIAAVKKLKDIPSIFSGKEQEIKTLLENKKLKGNGDAEWIEALTLIDPVL